LHRAYARCKVVDPSRPYTIGWSGSYSTSMYIRQMLPALASIAKTVPLRLLVIGAEGLSHPELEIECRPWRSATEVSDLLDIDVGLMPLADDAWAWGKCGLKALQYMALGIPAVISPVGVNTEIVTEGENGYLPRTDAEWLQAIQALADPVQRERQGESARITVHERYSAEIGAKKLAALLRRLEPVG
jgi:glycosyltransferase involved in cell wall biosynthesis